MKRNDPNRIDEEKVTIDSLYQHLRDRGIQNISVQRNNEDPPDYWMRIGDWRIGVEITSVVEEYTYFDQCSKFHNMLKTRLEETTCIEGSYVIVFSRKPKLPSKRTTDWSRLLEISEQFISATKNESPGTKLVLIKDRSGELSIEKVEETKSMIARVGPTDSR